jgi:hypothetical protein
MMSALMPRHHPASPVQSATVRAVRAGDDFTAEVEGGFVRRRVPSDGIVVQLPDRDVFVTAEALIEALRTLGRLSGPTR